MRRRDFITPIGGMAACSLRARSRKSDFSTEELR